MRVTLQIKTMSNAFIWLRLIICICQHLNCQLKGPVFLLLPAQDILEQTTL